MEILIVDDHPLFSVALQTILTDLNPEFDFLLAANYQQAMDHLGTDPHIALVLLDLSLPGLDGFTAFQHMKERSPTLPIVIISGVDSMQAIKKAMRVGAMGFIPKSSSGPEIMRALSCVLAGNIYLPPVFAAHIDDSGHPDAPDVGADVAAEEIGIKIGLTERQIQVLVQLIRGHSNKHIANTLTVSEATVKAHVTTILKALNVETRTQAVLKVTQTSP
jgi:DNA-binding NarL/FixJ family response regulator